MPEPKRGRYRGETAFPWVLSNLDRFAFYAKVIQVITDNAIIRLKGLMDDVYFDPIRWLHNRTKARAKSASSD